MLVFLQYCVNIFTQRTETCEQAETRLNILTFICVWSPGSPGPPGVTKLSSRHLSSDHERINKSRDNLTAQFDQPSDRSMSIKSEEFSSTGFQDFFKICSRLSISTCSLIFCFFPGLDLSVEGKINVAFPTLYMPIFNIYSKLQRGGRE